MFIRFLTSITGDLCWWIFRWWWWRRHSLFHFLEFLSWFLPQDLEKKSIAYPRDFPRHLEVPRGARRKTYCGASSRTPRHPAQRHERCQRWPAVGSHHGFSEDVQGYSNPLHVQITAITTIVYLVYIYSNNSNHLLLPISTLQTYLECWAQLWCWSSLFRVGTRRRKDFWLEGLNRDFGWMSRWTLILCIHCVCLNTTNF